MIRSTMIYSLVPFAAVAVQAQTSTISATHLLDQSGTAIARGSWCFGAECISIRNGALSGTAQVHQGTNNIAIQSGPANVLTINNVTIASSTFNFDTFVLQAGQSAQASGPPILAASNGATYTNLYDNTAWTYGFDGLTGWIQNNTVRVYASGKYSGPGTPTFVCTSPCDYTSTPSNSFYTLNANPGVASANWQLQATGGSSSGTGSGTVTTLTANGISGLFSANVATPNTAPSLNFSLLPQAPNLFFTGPASGSAATPAFRAIVPSDLPLGSNTALGALKCDGTTASCTNGTISFIGTGLAGTNGGTVTSVSANGISGLFSTTVGSPSMAPTLNFSLLPQAPNVFFRGPTSGSSAAPTFGAITSADLPLGTNTAAGALACDGTTTTCANGVISSTAKTSTIPATTGIYKGTGTANSMTAATAGVDYATPSQLNNVVNTTNSPPQSGIGTCQFVQGCVQYNTDTTTSPPSFTRYYQQYGSGNWIADSNQSGLVHQTPFAALPTATNWPNGTSWLVNDCLTTLCTAGGGSISETFTNLPNGTAWSVQVSGQGSGPGSNVMCSASINGSTAATANQTCQDETFVVTLASGTNNIALTGQQAGYRHTWILAQPATGNAVANLPATDKGAIQAGTDALTVTTQEFYTYPDGVNSYALSTGVQNLPSSFTVGTAAVNSTVVGSLSNKSMGMFYPKASIMKSWCPLCSPSSGAPATSFWNMLSAAGIHHMRILGQELSSPTGTGNGGYITYVANSPAHNTANDQIGNADMTNWVQGVCSQSDFTFTWDINYLGNTTANVVAEAQEIWNLAGPSGSVCPNRLSGIEIGNEPDNAAYGTFGSASATSFANGWHTFAVAVKNAIPAVVLVGPSVSSRNSYSTYVPPFMSANGSLIGVLTHHYYGSGNAAQASVAILTQNTVSANVASVGNTLGTTASQYANVTACDMNEGATTANGGAAGISNVFLAAVFDLTNMLDVISSSVPAGCPKTTVNYSNDGIPYYGSSYSQGYSAINNGSGYIGPNAPLYGYLLASLLGAGNLYNCSVTISSVNIRCWQIGNKLLLVNQDATQTAQLTTTFVGTASTATSLLTTASSLTGFDITVQGASIDKSSSTFTPGAVSQETVVSGNQITTIVPAHSIKIITMQ